MPPSFSILSFILTEVQLFNDPYIQERERIKERIENDGGHSQREGHVGSFT
ncbi:hypothetical protein HY839_04425 [Candidatus Azambacteria bacterium]|nr:hypothetical protein [Candidatus Azambacteria bacterium]